MKEVNDLWLQIDSKKILSCIDRQGKTFNTNIAEVQAQNVFFWPLDDIELVDWTTTNKFTRLWFCEDIHHSSVLKLAMKKAIQKSPNVVGRLDMYRTYVLLYRTMVLMARPTKVRC